MAFAAVFGYEVDAGAVEAFEAVYGPDGEWARFFRVGDGYLGTELWRGAGGERRFLVVDRWRSEAAYTAFLDAHEEEYRRRNEAAAGLYRRETVIGRFEVGRRGSRDAP